MLLKVKNRDDKRRQRTGHNSFRYAGFTLFLLAATFLAVSGQSAAQAPTTQNPPASIAPQNANPPTPNTMFPDSPRPRPGLNLVVLDPAHGGTDTGARGTGGIREREIVLQFALQVRRALESQGFQVIQTRMANENPSFDDRSAMANAQIGAVFVSLHVSSTGSPGIVRVYVNSDLPASSSGREASGLIPWDRAQAPFLGLSHKLGDFVQGNLAVRFKGSPGSVQGAAIRQLRTIAAPAIAVEISSVAVNDRLDLERIAPGVADAIARGVTDFRPSYVVAGVLGGLR